MPRVPAEVRERGEAEASRLPLLAPPALVTAGERLLDRAERTSVQRAEELFGFALEVDPNHGPARAGLARAAAMRLSRRWEEDDALIDRALDEARRAVALDPNDARCQAALAVASMIAEDWNGALEAADRAWALRSGTTPPWVTEIYATSLIARGDSEGALRIIDAAVEVRPDRFQIHFVRGNSLLFLGRYEEAVLAFQRVILLEPDFPPGMLQLADAHDRAGAGRIASRIYNDIGNRFPEERPRIRARIAASLISRKRYREALEALADVHFQTKRGLGEGTLLYLKGICLQGLGRGAEARGPFEQVIRDYPLASYGGFGGDGLAAASLEALAKIDLEEGRQDDAVRRMEEALASPRPTISLFLRLAGVYSSYNLHSEAVEVLAGASGVDFGPRQAGPKVAIYVAWARALRNLPPPAPDQATRLLAALDRDSGSLAARGEMVHILEAARACTIAGDRARGLQWVKTAVERGYNDLDWIPSDPEMSSLSRDPAYEEIRKRASRGL